MTWARRTCITCLLAGSLAGCGGPSSEPPALPQPQALIASKPGPVGARDAAGLGTVLVNSEGYTLYAFEPDGQHTVSCTDACAGSWPPVMLPAATAPAAGPGVRQDLLGSVPNPAGGQVVTYGGWPLYTYASDLAPGQANGQALDLNGGPWYVIRPCGQLVRPADPNGRRHGLDTPARTADAHPAMRRKLQHSKDRQPK